MLDAAKQVNIYGVPHKEVEFTEKKSQQSTKSFLLSYKINKYVDFALSFFMGFFF